MPVPGTGTAWAVQEAGSMIDRILTGTLGVFFLWMTILGVRDGVVYLKSSGTPIPRDDRPILYWMFITLGTVFGTIGVLCAIFAKYSN